MIAHVDADSFFASVLVRQNPSLKGKPLLALGMGGGCVIAASYEAKAKGVKTGMRLRDALALAPDALRLPSDFHETALASDQIESVLRDTCPRVEQMSVDEWFLDLRALPGGIPKDLQAFGAALRMEILARVGLSVSAGIAPTKTLAKMASEYRKPAGITVARTGGEIEAFLTDRPAAAIPGIGPRRIAHCESNGWTTAWDIAQAPPDRLKELFGRPGMELGCELRGEQIYPVTEEIAPPQSISRARSFRAERNEAIVWAHLLRHLEYTVLKMRRWKLACRGVSVWLRDGEFHYRSTHCPVPRALETEETLQPFVRRCFRELNRKGEACTQAGLALWKLCPGGTRQFSLFEKPEKALSEERVQQSLDELHEKFGRNSITKGSALKAQSGTKRSFEMPIYEEKQTTNRKGRVPRATGGEGEGSVLPQQHSADEPSPKPWRRR
jgi:DNA polymerase-4/DNA polymerase V